MNELTERLLRLDKEAIEILETLFHDFHKEPEEIASTITEIIYPEVLGEVVYLKENERG